ncbi:MAG: DUF4956 domain-containing protein [Caldilineales bacterium]
MNTIDFTSFLNSLQDSTMSFTATDVVLTIILSFVLSLVIAWIYRATHRGTSYSQSFVQTLIILAMVVGVVMLIIGSNIARAFTLVGALSIVRFRNAVKETRDVGFIFFAMVIGMACGTRFYLLAIVSTLVISVLIWIMVRQNMFAKDLREQILKIRVPSDVPYATLFDSALDKYLVRYDLMALESVQAGLLIELVYGVEFRRGASSQDLLNDVRRLNDNNKVVLVTGMHEVDL